MALPTSQPVPEILRGWTVSGGIPADVIEGINSGIYELYGGVIRIAAGNDAAGRIIRHRIPPRKSIAEVSQEMARMEQATLQGRVRILDESWDLRGRLDRIVALKKRVRWQAGRALIHRGSTRNTARLSEVPFR